MESRNHGLLIEADAGPGVLHRLSGIIAAHDGDIGTVSIVENTPQGARIYFEIAPCYLGSRPGVA
jgi:energy-converting hydrogenase B subunit Q